jgi:hypothetical protein
MLEAPTRDLDRRRYAAAEFEELAIKKRGPAFEPGQHASHDHLVEQVIR